MGASMKNWIGIVLAAGEGTRMSSSKPKVLHDVCGKPMILYAIDALRKSGVADIVIIVSSSSGPALYDLLGDSVYYVKQDDPLGTGNAVLESGNNLAGESNNIIVMGGDTPLIHSSTIESMMVLHSEQESPITVLTSTGCVQEDMGRIVRDNAGHITGILEASDDRYSNNPKEGNAGVYCFTSPWIWDNIKSIKSGPTGEFYITSMVQIASSQDYNVQTFILQDPYEAMGVNDRVQLSEAEATLRQRIRDRWMREGITMIDPSSTFVDSEVTLGRDTILYPNTIISGTTRIGRACSIGPGSSVHNSFIGDNCKINNSIIEETAIEGDVSVGPFSHLREGTYIESRAHVGNFVEVKESRIGRETKVGHFGYIGDATVGRNVNLGAGMVTCNFDGTNKNLTTISDEVFIGSGTMLVAPINVGSGAFTAAGSVVTRDVPSFHLAKGSPAKSKPRLAKD